MQNNNFDSLNESANDTELLEYYKIFKAIDSDAIVDVYVDGSCVGNPGPGGWGAYVLAKSLEPTEWFGSESMTTNQRMELFACIAALTRIPKNLQINIYTDSAYVKNGITTWIFSWMKKNWQTSKNEPVKNKELWQALYQQTLNRKINWQWIKGHSGIPGNEKADRLANKGATAAVLNTL